MEKHEREIEDWCLSLSRKKPYYITERDALMIKDLNPNYFEDFISSYAIGRVVNHPKFKKGERMVTSRVVACSDRVVTEFGNQYFLGQRNESYAWHDYMINCEGLPVLSNWSLGVDWRNRYVIAGNMFKDFEMASVKGVIKDQDLVRNTIEIKGYGRIFVNWDAINDQFEQVFKRNRNYYTLTHKQMFQGHQFMLDTNVPVKKAKIILPDAKASDPIFDNPRQTQENNPVYKLVMKR